jgi:putative lipoic acid-binding regulatory protein
MKKILLFFVIALLIGCSRTNSNTDSESSLEQLSRIDKLLSQKNKTLYDQFYVAKLINSEFAGKSFKKAQELHMLINDIQGFILDKNASIKNNLTVSELLKLTFAQIDSLDINKEIIDTLKQRHINYWIEKDLSNPLSRELCTSISIDLRLFEFEIMDYLYKELTANDFNFNVIKPVIIETTNEVKTDEFYEVKIGLTAYDTTRNIYVKVENQVLDVVDGYAIYRYHASASGKKKVKGTIEFPRNNYEMELIPFDLDFVVK